MRVVTHVAIYFASTKRDRHAIGAAVVAADVVVADDAGVLDRHAPMAMAKVTAAVAEGGLDDFSFLPAQLATAEVFPCPVVLFLHHRIDSVI